MLTKCPYCGQVHEFDATLPQEHASPACPVDAMAPASPPLPVTFILEDEGPPAETGGTPEAQSSAPSGNDHAPTAIPWEGRTGALDFKAYWRTTRGILLHPAHSFARWDAPADMEGALLFLVFFGSFGQVLANYWVRLLQAGTASTAAPADNWIAFGLFVLQAPLMVLVSTFLTAVLTHFFLFLLRATSQPWTKTFALFAYLTGALACLQLIPFVGLVLAPFWGLVAAVCGLRQLHGTTTGQVVAAFLLPLALILSLLFLLALLIIGTGLAILNSLPWP
jgi:hypothetical protein